MDERRIKETAPCGISCYTCSAYKNGVIKECACTLSKSLEGFDKFAEKFSSMNPELSNFEEFKNVLSHFSSGNCEGCRNRLEDVPYCAIPSCIREKGIEFCSECKEFPCTKSGLFGELKDTWLKNTRKMKELGKEEYLYEIEAEPHYK